MSARAAGAWLVAAALLFWLSWSLMPGVGITDARRILDLVGQHRSRVAVSVALQLLSAACYAPALAGLLAQPALAAQRGVRGAAILLLIGAMGSAADAVFHLLAHAMTAPGLDPAAFVAAMEAMQGPGLRFILPLIAAFFAGSVWLSIALARLGVVPLWNPLLYALALAIALGGGVLASEGESARRVGLAVLALVAAAQSGIGAALWRRGLRPRADRD